MTTTAISKTPSGETAPAPLATLGVVTCVHPIPGADNIEIVHISLGCELAAQTITRKGEFKPDDFGVYIRSGGVVPQTDPFEFIWGPYLHEGGSITPNRRRRIGERYFLREVSEGLIMPTTDFPAFQAYHSSHGDWASLVGTDISSQVGVKRYTLPATVPKVKKVKKTFRALGSEARSTAAGATINRTPVTDGSIHRLFETMSKGSERSDLRDVPQTQELSLGLLVGLTTPPVPCSRREGPDKITVLLAKLLLTRLIFGG
jgi:hypothetical protein